MAIKTFTFANEKGGVTKTTSLLSVAHKAAMEGHRVLILDVDPQSSCASALGVDSGKNAYYALTEEDRDPRSFILSTRRDNLWIIPGNRHTSRIEDDHKLEELTFHDVLFRVNAFTRGYDYLFVDTPPTFGYLQNMAIALATHLVIPTTMSFLSIEKIGPILRTVESLRANGSQAPERITILPTLTKAHTNATKDNLAELAQHYADYMPTIFDSVTGEPLFLSIPQLQEGNDAVDHVETIWEYRPNGKVARAYELLTHKLLNGDGTHG